MAQHRAGAFPRAFTVRYNVDKLVYVEAYELAREAARRERQLKGWRRAKKVALINAENPAWRDLVPAEASPR